MSHRVGAICAPRRLTKQSRATAAHQVFMGPPHLLGLSAAFFLRLEPLWLEYPPYQPLMPLARPAKRRR